MSEELTLRLTLTVSYKLNGATSEDMEEQLKGAVDHAIQNGLLTGDSPAEVTTFETAVDGIHASAPLGDEEILKIAVYAQNCTQAGKRCWKEDLIESKSMDIHILEGTREELLGMAEGFANRPNNADGLYWMRVARTIKEELG